MDTAPRTLTRCLVCGFSEVRTDEVVDRGLVLLAECGRCQHRWTASLDGPGRARGARSTRSRPGSGREGAHAA